MATVEDQTEYNQYQKVDGSGYPGISVEVSPDIFQQEPEPLYQAGFVCYSYVVRAIRDAGININNSTSVNELINQLNRINTINSSTVMSGDIIAYDWDGDGYWDHTGVINDVSGNDPNDWSVFSSNGLVEYFEWGAREARLGAFRNSAAGGYFDWWNYPTTYAIFTKRSI